MTCYKQNVINNLLGRTILVDQENVPPRENVTTIWRTISQTPRAPNSFPDFQ